MISIQQLTKTFGKLTALDQISTELPDSTCLALIGPNGSGKTTLAKSILGIVHPDKGQIIYKGKNIIGDFAFKSSIGYMPQIGRYPENMTIGQILDMIKDIRGEKHLDEDLSDAFSLNKLLHKTMRSLSGGTTQKVSAALAFLFDPEVLMLDEPTAGLDPVAQGILKEKILLEKSKGKLIVITSHILSELDDLVSAVLYMQEGKLLFNKTIEQLREQTGQVRLSSAIAQIMQSNPIS
ncbi:Cu-processing system ATP-binding protein [Arachidicoccus rhizosphaerae]|uniref:Cu-processing system ATP-binding protein n=1 Tax=Arachidicoccus rhizosphaerae TaxID=551991 RepID=A0A1H4BAA4_9BACT|nr:ABC transporter ATP-binding protein [Arachidicoccus rhizosphaerae]SEA45071.1 Cu-processing system ATP-binding protein [Arachidicoccus rhizosphaerae]